MKISSKRFVIAFLIVAVVFQFATNSLLGSEVGLFPNDGVWYPGAQSSVSWKNNLAAIIYPVKFILIQPLSFLGQDPDPVPPVMLIAFTLYWTLLAFVLHFLLSLLFNRKSTMNSGIDDLPGK